MWVQFVRQESKFFEDEFVVSESVDQSTGIKKQALFDVDTGFYAIFVVIQMFEFGGQK